MNKGDKVKYRALGTNDVYDAEITGVRVGGHFFDIEVITPNTKERIELHAIRADRLSPAPVS